MPFQNRRFTQKEMEQEKEIAAIFRRPPRHFFYDPPYYPWLPPAPIANFALRFKDTE